jgi:hypothetical protein
VTVAAEARAIEALFSAWDKVPLASRCAAAKRKTLVSSIVAIGGTSGLAAAID